MGFQGADEELRRSEAIVEAGRARREGEAALSLLRKLLGPDTSKQKYLAIGANKLDLVLDVRRLELTNDEDMLVSRIMHGQ